MPLTGALPSLALPSLTPTAAPLAAPSMPQTNSASADLPWMAARVWLGLGLGLGLA